MYLAGNNVVDIKRVNEGEDPKRIPVNILSQVANVNNVEKTVWHSSQARYIRQEAAGVTTIESTSAQDTNITGTGIWTVKVSGLDNDFKFIQEVVELNGLTPVTLTKQYIAINELNPELAGTAKTAQGDIIVKIGTDVLSVIDSGNVENISRQMIFTSPYDATYYAFFSWMSTGGTDEIAIRIYVTNPINGIPILQHAIYLGGGNASPFGKITAIKVPPKHLLEVTAQSTAAVTRTLSCSIEGYLKVTA